MIQITPHMRILVAVEPIDFRAGIDGLAAACRKRLQADPFSGCLFVFSNRTRKQTTFSIPIAVCRDRVSVAPAARQGSSPV
jgi:transposase